MKHTRRFYYAVAVMLLLFTVGALVPVAAAPANGPKNKYGLPYDPNAVVSDSFGGRVLPYQIGDKYEFQYIREEMDRTRGELHFIDNLTDKLLGNYDYKNQCWLYYGDELKSCWIAINENFYDSIDLSKTLLNRDRYGTAYNRYGLPYDPDAVVDLTLNNVEIRIGSLFAYYEGVYGDDTSLALIRFYDSNYDDCGLYMLAEQCWTFYNDDILDTVDIGQFYDSIDLSITDLNRDWYGNPVGIDFARATPATAEAFDAWFKNQYGLKYDPNAIVDWSKDGAYIGKVKALFNKWDETIEIDYTTYDYGIYDYKNQCWIEYTDAMKNAYVDLSELFVSVSLSAEELNRDIYGNKVCRDTEAVERTGYIGSNTNGRFLHFYAGFFNPDVNNLGGYEVYVNQPDDYYAYFCKTINGEQKIFACYNFSKQYWYYRAGYDGRPAVNGEKFNSSAIDPSKLYQVCDPRIDYNRTKPADGIEFADINDFLGYTYEVHNYNGSLSYYEPQQLYFDTNAKLALDVGQSISIGSYTVKRVKYSYDALIIEKNGVSLGQYDPKMQRWLLLSPEVSISSKELSAVFSEVDPSVNLSRIIDRPSDVSYQSLNPGVIWTSVLANNDDDTGFNLTNVPAMSTRLSNGVNLSKFNEASGKSKVLVFFDCDYDSAKNTISSIRDSLSSFNNVDLLLLGESSDYQEEFRWEYGSSAMKMYFGDFYNLHQNYMDKVYNLVSYVSQYPFVVYIDGKNKIQYMEYAPDISASDILNTIDRFLVDSGYGVFYDSTAIADTSVKKLGKYTLTWGKTYVTFSEREKGRDVIKACYNHCYQYWEYQAGKKGYMTDSTPFDSSQVDLSRLYRKVDKSVKLSRSAPAINELTPLLAKKTYSGTKCSVGDIVLQDGSIVSPASYRSNSRNPAIGVVAFFRDENFPNSKDAGTQTGNVEDAVIFGTKRDKKALIVPQNTETFYVDDDYESHDILSTLRFYDITYSSKRVGQILTYSLESDTDGSNNYAIIKATIDEALATNPNFKRFGKVSYPAFEAAENYGKTNNISGTFRNGWYVPSAPEMDYIDRNKRTINESISKISGADIFRMVEDGNDPGYLYFRNLKCSSATSYNTFSAEGYYSYGHVWDPGLVFFIRNYADVDPSYSGRPANIVSQGTFGEKSEPNAVGDIVFTDGSATSLRDGLILTTEQKKAVMAVGAYIGDGFIGETDYLYLASVNRNNHLPIVNNETTPASFNEKDMRIPITYDTMVPSDYPFVGMVNDGAKNWEYIKKYVSWATGVKDRSGDYVKGFMQFLYADLYGSGKSFTYKNIEKERLEENPSLTFSTLTLTTPQLEGRYSSGWYIPAYAESKLLSWSLNRIGEKVWNATDSDVLCSGPIDPNHYSSSSDKVIGSNRVIWLDWFTVGFRLNDMTSTSDVFFHKAGKVSQEDLKLSAADLGPDRCYVGDIVLANGSIVHMDEYDDNPKNPAIGVIAFFKNKSYDTGGIVLDYTGTKENAVIVGLKMHEGTWNEANDFAASYGKKNNITGIYKDDWYLPSIDERFNINAQLIGKSLTKIGESVEASLLDNTNLWLWTSSVNNEGPLIARNYPVKNQNAVYYSLVVHGYVEPEKLIEVENDHGMVTDRTHPYKVGDIVLADGSIVSAAQYKPNTRNPAVGVIAFFKDGSFPNSGNYGSRTGTKENAYIIGLQQKQGEIKWAAKGAQGLKDITAVRSYPSSLGYGAATAASFYPGSDNDGSDNWSLLCAAVTDENIAGRYPAFEYAESYGKTAGITGSYSSGWYLPTIAELSYVYRNKRFINESLELIDGATRINGALYRSSSQNAFDGNGTYSMNGITGSIEYESKTMDYDAHGVLVIRPLCTSYKAPVQWSEPVVKAKTATNQLLKRSYGGQIGQKAKPTAVGDIIFSDGSATAYSSYLSLTQKQKNEAVAIASFVGDGKIGQKGKIYGVSLLSKECTYYDDSTRLHTYDNSHEFPGYTWCNAYGKNSMYDQESSYGVPHISSCYPNGMSAADGFPIYDEITYFTGDCDGSDYWSEICKIDPYGAVNSESYYPAWDFVLSLGEGWYIGSSAEMWMVEKNADIIDKARIAVDYEKMQRAWTSTYSGSDMYPFVAGVIDDSDSGYYQYQTFGLYAFDIGNAAAVTNQAAQSTQSGSGAASGNGGFVLVDGGTFKMGNASGQNDEKPAHNVTLSSFYICDHEVTQAEYKAVMGTNPSDFSGNNKPVEQVSWYDAIEYCNKLSKKEGLTPCYSLNGNTDTSKWGAKGNAWNSVVCDFNANGYRLLTESEWEYAARGGSKSTGYTYSGANAAPGVAWNKDNAGNGTHDVKNKNANELGLYDMSGNVSEWVWDWYGNYSSASATNPKGASSGSYRARRGGSWSDASSSATVTYRDGNSPARTKNDRGFRVARSAK